MTQVEESDEPEARDLATAASSPQKAERIPATSDVETLGNLGIGVGGARSPKAARQAPRSWPFRDRIGINTVRSLCYEDVAAWLVLERAYQLRPSAS